MITIFHGDDYVTSRQNLNQALDVHRQSKAEIVKFEAKELKPESLTQTLESISLFGSTKVTVIHELFSLPRSKAKTEFINLVLKNSNQTILIWDKKSLTPANLKLVSKTKDVTIKTFKLEKLMFKFLDAIKFKNGNNVVNLLHRALESNPIELIFFMLARRISQLIQAKDDPQSLKAAPWQISQLKNQSSSFESVDQLIDIHSKLLTLDTQTKTGQTPVNLATRLDLLLINL